MDGGGAVWSHQSTPSQSKLARFFSMRRGSQYSLNNPTPQTKMPLVPEVRFWLFQRFEHELIVKVSEYVNEFPYEVNEDCVGHIILLSFTFVRSVILSELIQGFPTWG